MSSDATVDLSDPELPARLEAGKIITTAPVPMVHWEIEHQAGSLDKATISPLSEEVFDTYDESRETYRVQDYA